MSKEAISLQIAIILSRAKDEDSVNEIVSDAKHMAIRAIRAKTDPSWWTLVGRPHFNKRMQKLRKSL